jgi:hypothetical protein
MADSAKPTVLVNCWSLLNVCTTNTDQYGLDTLYNENIKRESKRQTKISRVRSPAARDTFKNIKLCPLEQYVLMYVLVFFLPCIHELSLLNPTPNCADHPPTPLGPLIWPIVGWEVIALECEKILDNGGAHLRTEPRSWSVFRKCLSCRRAFLRCCVNSSTQTWST